MKNLSGYLLWTDQTGVRERALIGDLITIAHALNELEKQDPNGARYETLTGYRATLTASGSLMWTLLPWVGTRLGLKQVGPDTEQYLGETVPLVRQDTRQSVRQQEDGV